MAMEVEMLLMVQEMEIEILKTILVMELITATVLLEIMETTAGVLGLESLYSMIIAKCQNTQSKSAIRFLGTPQATSCIEERELKHLQLKTKKMVLG